MRDRHTYLPTYKAAYLLLTLSLILLSGLGTKMVQAEEAPFIPGEFILSISNEKLQDKALDMLDDATREPLAVTDSSQIGIKIETPAGFDRDADPKSDVDICEKLTRHIRRLRQQGETIVRRYDLHCDRNGILTTSDIQPNDPMYQYLWGLNRLQMPQVWQSTIGSNEVIVAVIDTGVNYNHPDLVDNMWRNPGEISNNGIDDDGNGYIDDIYGYNAINNTGNPMDDNGHGTHVAGTIGARGNNSQGVVGVNWNVKIMGAKFLSGSGSGSLWDAVNALRYVRTMKERGHNIVLSNNSWGGGGYYSVLYDEIQAAQTAGMLFVAAAGNSGINSDSNPQYPAAYNLSNIISVAAIDSSGLRASFSNYGATTVDIGAPGVNIGSTWHTGGYNYISGTSMACPHVAGAAALLKAYSAGLTPAGIKAALLESASPNASLTGVTLTNGELNILGALSRVPYNPYVPGTPTPTPTVTPTPTRTPTPTATPIPPTPTATPLPQVGNWSLQVFGDNMLGLGQVAVQISGPGSYSASGITAANGSLNLANLPGGNYSLTLSKSGYLFGENLTFRVNGNTSTNVQATRSTYSIKGNIIRKADAAVIPHASVDIYLDSQLVGTTQSDALGAFSFNFPYGATYRFEISLESYYSASVEGEVIGRATRTIALTDN